MRFRLEVTTIVELPYKPEQYPAGLSPQEALTLEMEELGKDPRELMALDSAVVGLKGMIVQDDQKPFYGLAERIFSSAAE